MIDAATSLMTLFHGPAPCAATAPRGDRRSLTRTVGVFGDVFTNRGSRLSRDLFDVIGGSVVASGTV